MSWFKDTKRRLTHKFLEFVGVAGSSRHEVMEKSRERCEHTAWRVQGGRDGVL